MDSKAYPPPNYTTTATPPGPPPAGHYPPQPYDGQAPYASPQGPPPPQPGYFPPQQNSGYQGPVGGMGGYSTGGTPQVAAMSAGAQYQQQLFALCAQGNHDITTKYGVAGIITAIVCFPCGLIALFLDVEKRCVRCGQRVG